MIWSDNIPPGRTPLKKRKAVGQNPPFIIAEWHQCCISSRGILPYLCPLEGGFCLRGIIMSRGILSVSHSSNHTPLYRLLSSSSLSALLLYNRVWAESGRSRACDVIDQTGSVSSTRTWTSAWRHCVVMMTSFDACAVSCGQIEWTKEWVSGVSSCPAAVQAPQN